ncbi:Aspartate--tRNA ligase-like protein [Emericellopsis cladophorae]|uniref:Aspartate--tRNA ligase-like protein n=1 Tax=Emericellopsis cladophorae TaxID=2686198 RepID=A0A9P9Y8D0_9HYPO|nr:Aspartate--tRNA ligase-like protein [Emericellopsis cladophorae]KAI6784664.1 Aspartate--tRNA ligase-like protein [Emericellopsis cladophorae]
MTKAILHTNFMYSYGALIIPHNKVGVSDAHFIQPLTPFQANHWSPEGESLQGVPPEKKAQLMDAWSQYRERVQLPLENGANGRYVGSIGKRRKISKHLSFADLTLPSGQVYQLCAKHEHDAEAHNKFKNVLAHAPVLVTGDLETASERGAKPTIHLRDIQTLNDAPSNLVVTPETVFPPAKRHLQMKFHPEIQARLRFRSWLKGVLNNELMNKGFTEVETPTLFKSTPEGAREFLVPTRQKGLAYALTQSPQQYKQILVASGIGRYMQWARCYRDEDSRADRQPEFSQLDMEWAFAKAEHVQKDVEDIVLKSIKLLQPDRSYQTFRDGARIPVLSSLEMQENGGPPAHSFERLTFAEAIKMYGSDKPDLRIPGRINAIPIPDSAKHFVSMITHLEDPLVEAFSFSLSEDLPPSQVQRLIVDFMDGLPKEFTKNPHGMPQILIHDSSKPLGGFSSIGHDYESIVSAASSGQELNDGDIVVFQARPVQNGQYTSSSTKIGDLRRLLWTYLVENEAMSRPPQLGEPDSLKFAWITEFPMFQPIESDEPWKAIDAHAGIAACHHPFTAPLAKADLESLFTDPLQSKSAAYDLVLNGTEVGGGSERIHIAAIQSFIMRDILRMSDERVADFKHLFDALESGCPPHAGFALGFDRLCALLTDTSTVKDVIAFPKGGKGEDPFVKAPGQVTEQQLKEYGLRWRD